MNTLCHGIVHIFLPLADLATSRGVDQGFIVRVRVSLLFFRLCNRCGVTVGSDVVRIAFVCSSSDDIALMESTEVFGDDDCSRVHVHGW